MNPDSSAIYYFFLFHVVLLCQASYSHTIHVKLNIQPKTQGDSWEDFWCSFCTSPFTLRLLPENDGHHNFPILESLAAQFSEAALSHLGWLSLHQGLVNAARKKSKIILGLALFSFHHRVCFIFLKEVLHIIDWYFLFICTTRLSPLFYGRSRTRILLFFLSFSFFEYYVSKWCYIRKLFSTSSICKR